MVKQTNKIGQRMTMFKGTLGAQRLTVEDLELAEKHVILCATTAL